MNEQMQDRGTDRCGDEGPRGEDTEPDHPHEVEGRCSRCGGRWPCLRCLTSTPPYVRVNNNF